MGQRACQKNRVGPHYSRGGDEGRGNEANVHAKNKNNKSCANPRANPLQACNEMRGQILAQPHTNTAQSLLANARDHTHLGLAHGDLGVVVAGADLESLELLGQCVPLAWDIGRQVGQCVASKCRRYFFFSAPFPFLREERRVKVTSLLRG